MSEVSGRKIQKVVITGATGTIGIALVKACISRQIQVVVLANPASTRLLRIPKSSYVTVTYCALEDLGSARASDILNAGENHTADVFFHFAWGGTFGALRNDFVIQENNVKYALDAVRLAKSMGCHTFVGAGSQAEYGRVSGMLRPDTPCNPETGYGIYKLKAERDTRSLCSELGLNHIWPRVLSVYGPYDGERTMIMSTIHKLLNNERPALTPGGQMWDFLYCDDAARAFLDLAQRGISGNVYPLGSGIARPLREYVEILRDAINPSLELGFGEVPYSQGQVMHLQADIESLTKDTGFMPSVTFEEGIEKTIDWMRQREDR